jgi:hypothetical protein
MEIKFKFHKDDYYYALDEDGNPVPVQDLDEWARSFRGNNMVDHTTLGKVSVSTVFLGMNHQYGGGPPLLFETMIFGGKYEGYQVRYSTRDEAIAGHRRAVEMVRIDRVPDSIEEKPKNTESTDPEEVLPQEEI